MKNFDRKGGSDATKGRELGADCTRVRSEIASFFDWARYSDCRRRAAWETWATRKVLAGDSVAETVEHVKQAWYTHRAALGLSKRIEVPEPEVGVQLFGATLAILEHKLNPGQAAVLFRGLERDHPQAVAIRLCREACEKAGDHWPDPEAAKDAETWS